MSDPQFGTSIRLLVRVAAGPERRARRDGARLTAADPDRAAKHALLRGQPLVTP